LKVNINTGSGKKKQTKKSTLPKTPMPKSQKNIEGQMEKKVEHWYGDKTFVRKFKFDVN